MCVAAVAFHLNLTYPFVLAHNRDEWYGRPATTLETDKHGVAGGLDLQSGGRWLGVVNNERQKGFAFVTNHRLVGKSSQYGDRSRGLLVSRFLESGKSVEAYHKEVEDSFIEYQPFNFVAGDFESLRYFNSVSFATETIEEGVFAISNGDPKTPWPKAERLAGGVKNILSTGLDEKRIVQNLFLLLSDTQKTPDELLPSTGVPYELEKDLSSIFIALPNYGTRSSTLVLRDAAGTVKIWERTFFKDRRPITNQVLL